MTRERTTISASVFALRNDDAPRCEIERIARRFSLRQRRASVGVMPWLALPHDATEVVQTLLRSHEFDGRSSATQHSNRSGAEVIHEHAAQAPPTIRSSCVANGA